MDEIAREIQELAAQIEEITQRYKAESEELKARCDAMRQRLQAHLNTVSSVKAAMDKQLTPEQLADLIAGRLSSGTTLVEPKPASTPDRTLGYYLGVLESGAMDRLDAAVDALEQLGKKRGDTLLRIAELWSHFPTINNGKNTKDAVKARDAYRTVCAMAVGEKVRGLPKNSVVSEWLRSPITRKRLERIADTINPDDPLHFDEDVSPGTIGSLTAIKANSFYQRWARARKKADPLTDEYLRPESVMLAKDAPLSEKRDD